jgi:hypothetical protein
MPQRPPDSGALPPRWLLLVGSVAILLHLTAVAVVALDAPSGPWPTPFGTSTALAPQFARSGAEAAAPLYARTLKLANGYRPATNRPATPNAFFEVRLKDEQGQVLTTLKFPDDNANFWVRHRQNLLARALADDQQLEAVGGERVAAPGHKAPSLPIWELDGPRRLRMRDLPDHLLRDVISQRGGPVFRPSEWSLVLARSYARFLCRAHGAASAEIIRHTRDPIYPVVLFEGEPAADAFQDLIATFGEMPR